MRLPTRPDDRARALPLSPILRALLSVLLASLWLTTAQAQVPPATDEAATEAKPAEEVVDPLGRETPRGMVEGLLDSLRSGDLDRAASYLDLSDIPERAREPAGRQLVTSLETVLDRSGEIVPSFRLSIDPAGIQDDGLEQGVDVFAEIIGVEEDASLTAHRVEGSDGTLIWLVSSEAIEIIRQRVNATPVGLVDRAIPNAWADVRLGGAPLSHWIALGVLLLVSLAAARAIVAGAGHLGRRI